MYNYHVQNQWGGNSAPWHEGGAWVLGYRNNQACVAIDIQSGDGGKTFHGTMTYAGEGPIGFQGTLVCGNTYVVQNQWGGNSAPWHPGGHWVIGARDGQRCVALKVTSADNGMTMTGTNTYAGEGPIGFKATAALKQHSDVQNQWGGDSAPWHEGGAWILSSREPQLVEAINITSGDGGKTFTGSMQYAGEGPIGTKCIWVMGNTYTVQNQWGGNSAPWHDAGQWLIGGRDGQRCVALNVKGSPLAGQNTYAGEGPIGFKSVLEG